MRKTNIIATALIAITVFGTVVPAALAQNNGSSNNSNNTPPAVTDPNSNPTAGAAPVSGTTGGGLASGEDCYTAVYDQQDDKGTFAHYGKGEWDADRQLCMHVKSFTQSFMKNINAVEAAQTNPFIHVMYVIDRTQEKLYAPCGANTDNGVLTPGTYDLNSLTKVDSNVPNLGSGANCLITG